MIAQKNSALVQLSILFCFLYSICTGSCLTQIFEARHFWNRLPYEDNNNYAKQPFWNYWGKDNSSAECLSSAAHPSLQYSPSQG